ncbi:MAG TPA: GtrA family protein [Allosphingosinicella sp.]|nr:GtrA family protein [Allosphingosinicella sp.]
MKLRSAIPPLFGQVIRFGLVGGFVTVVGMAVYYFPATFMGVPPLLSNLLAYVVAMGLGYGLHSTVSFRGHGSRDNPARRTGRFFIVSLVSLGLNSLFVWVLTGLLDGPTWWPLVPMLLVTPAVTFALNRQWVFG